MFGAFTSFGKLGSLARAIAAAWSPSALYAASQVGAWYDPSDLSTMFTDAAGTTPVVQPGTVADQPVGLITDKSPLGIDASQSTSTARPLLSARVNLLTYTEDFSNAVWQLLFGLEKTPNYALAPDGTMTACRLYAPSAEGVLYGHGLLDNTHTRSIWAKSNTGSNTTLDLGTGNQTVTPTWSVFTATATGNDYLWNMSVIAGGDISVWHPQYELGSTATTYQRVTTASDYDGTPGKFPYYLKFEVDDYLSTAAIDFTGTDKITAFVGLQNATTAVGMYADFGLGANGSFAAMSGIGALGDIGIYKKGIGSNGSQATAAKPAGTTGVLSFSIDFAGATPDLQNPLFHWDGANAGVQTNTDIGGGVFGNRALYIGARSGPVYPFNGNLYSLIIAGALYDAATITEAETWVAGKTGVTL